MEEEEEDPTCVMMKKIDTELKQCIQSTKEINLAMFGVAPVEVDDWNEKAIITMDTLNKFTPYYDIMMSPIIPMINLFDFEFDKCRLERHIKLLWKTLQPQLKIDQFEDEVWIEKLKHILRAIAAKSTELKVQPRIDWELLKEFISLVKCNIELENTDNREDDIKQIQFEISYCMILSQLKKKDKTQPESTARGVSVGSDLTATWVILEQLLNHALTCCESNTLVDGGVHESSPPVATQLRYSSKCTSMDLSSARL